VHQNGAEQQKTHALARRDGRKPEVLEQLNGTLEHEYGTRRLTFELTGVRRPAKPAVAFPVQRRVRPHLGWVAA
jgi:hypothetical protein